MSTESQLDELLLLWEERRERGEAPTVEELCRDCPELTEPLRRQIAALRAFEPLIETRAAETTDDAGAPDSATGRPTVPGYEILGELGRGGMGVVYKARDLRLKRLVAVKMILVGAHAGKDQAARFQHEAEAVARLKHPHIVQIYGMGEQDGRPFLALELVEGGSLDRKLAAGPMAPGAAAALVETLARAVHAAHERGIVHRDLKPGNVLLAADGTPKITDFGLAKELTLEPGAAHTQSGAVVGTPSYMAPEQALGKTGEVGPAADVYALGAILYELLTGQPPFRGKTLMETLEQVIGREPRPPRRLRPSTPRDLEVICLKCLRKEKARRYASAADLAEDLRRFRAGEPIRARPAGLWERGVKWARRRPAAVAILLLLVLAGLGLGGLVWRWQADQAEQAAHALKVEYYATFRNRAGGAEGVGRLTEEEARHRQTTFRFRRRDGRTEGFDVIDGRGRPTTNHNLSAFLDGLNGQVVQRQCIYNYQYTREGIPVEVTASDRAGKPVFTLQFPQPDLALYVRAGFPSPRVGSGASYVRFAYDADGYYVGQFHLAGQNAPRPDHDGVYGMRFENNADGLPVRINYLGPDGKTPTYHKDGYTAQTRRYDERGEILEVSFWDLDGEPALTSDGYHAIQMDYDRWGNLAKQTFVGLDGASTRSKAGYARTRYVYDDHGDCTAMEYRDENNRLSPVDGACRIIWEYDGRGGKMGETYRDADDRPTARYGITAASYRYDEKGEEIGLVERLADPEKRADKCRTVTAEERSGQTTEVICRDAAGAPALDADLGYAHYKAEYDDRGELTGEAYYDAEDRPVAPYGYCSIHYAYDAAGNRSRVETFDAAGKAVACSEGYAVLKLEYDELGNNVGREYVDTEGRPARLKNGSCGLAARYDMLGRAVESTYLDANRKPLQGAARWKMEYDHWGNLKDQTWWDADDHKAVGPDGWRRKKMTYDRWGDCLSEEYFDRDDRPKALADGASKWVYTYDVPAHRVRAEGFDADGRRVK